MKSALFEQTKSLMLEEVRPTAVTRDAQAVFPSELTEKARAAGIYSACVPKEFGGLGLSLPESCQLYFDMGRYSLDLGWVTSVGATAFVALDLVVQFLEKKRKERIVQNVMEGGQLCIANSEAGAGTNVTLMKSRIEESGRLAGCKDCVTNAPVADHAFISAKRKLGDKSVIEVYLVPRSMLKVTPLHANLLGYRTSSTGKIEFDIENFDVDAHLVGTPAGGLQQFKRCFDMERLILSCAVAGLLQGLEDTALESQRNFSDKQYIQQKLLTIYSAKEKIWSLVQRALTVDASQSGQLLGLMKWTVIRQGLEAAMAFMELAGHSALFTDHIAQKVVRDMIALRFFGGTMELQKIAIFQGFGSGQAPLPLKKSG